MELQLALKEELLERSRELASEDATENSDWQEEPWRRRDPAGAIKRQTASWNDAMQVGMMLQVLPQVCKTLSKPISAPRCFGSRATSSSVAAVV